MTLDPRLHAYREDIADVRLKDRVTAARYVAGEARRVVAPSAPLKRTPRADAALDTEVLAGEVFTVFDDAGEGWSWGQLATDGCVGYVPADALGAAAPAPTHRIATLRTFVFPAADMKMPALGHLSFRAAVALGREMTTRGTPYRELTGGRGWIVARTAETIDAPPANDFVSVAERFLGTAYLWGGRTSVGLDCSALVQLSLAAAGIRAPRDTDLQEGALGDAVPGNVRNRGDLVFWRGHVGIMIDGEYLVHANGHHMAVVIEPLADVTGRVGAPVVTRRL